MNALTELQLLTPRKASTPVSECDLLNDVIATTSFKTLHPLTISTAVHMIDTTIFELLTQSRIVSDYSYHVEQNSQDFLYGLSSWMRNLIRDRFDLLLNEWYLKFVSLSPHCIELDDDYLSEEDEDYLPEEDSQSASFSEEEGDFRDLLEEEGDIEDEEKEFRIDSSQESFSHPSTANDEEDHLFGEPSDTTEQLASIHENDCTNSSVNYQPLSGAKLQSFRRYCHAILTNFHGNNSTTSATTSSSHTYSLIHDEVFQQLHHFLFLQVYLSFQANPVW